MEPKQTQSQKQSHMLMMLPQMQQAITMLQVPVMELSALIEEEIERNPMLEYSQESEEKDEDMQRLERDVQEHEGINDSDEKEVTFDDDDFTIIKKLEEDFRDLNAENYTPMSSDDFKHKTFTESSIVSPVSLFKYLMEQAQETFESAMDLELAENIIGNFDEKGFLTISLEEIAVLQQVDLHDLERVLSIIKKNFDPTGVGASGTQEALLLQLEAQNLKSTLAYTIVSEHYEDLLHNRIPTIQSALKCTTKQIRNAIDKIICKLDLRPGCNYSITDDRPITPDVTLRQDGEQLVIDINQDSVPSLRVNSRYLRMLEDQSLPLETKEYIKRNILSAKWFVRNIYQRNETLTRITEYLKVKQVEFFTNPSGHLSPLTMKEIADELDLHESTIARAVANKYIECPRGLLPMRSFFTNTYTTEDGEDLSVTTVRKAISKIIEQEDKSHPHSDEYISKVLKKQGITCARRTVAKHRQELSIGNTLQRRKYE
jgi:RNA polymerase sigma-54 factor